ncbi:MAG TPA: response regulator [Anaerolineae bacterium]|nr:response regulator [Anaerolineae bacterium]
MKQDTLLIVEDNVLLRDAIAEMLTMDGFFVLTAGNGEEALSQMESVSPDLILSDISMPVMDGFEFFHLIRERQEWLSIPFIFLTARGDQAHVLTGKGLGAEDYLIKPVNHTELLTAIRARLSRSQQLRLARLREAYQASLTVLANAIEVRDRYTRGHVERVTAYAIVLGEQLGWSGKQLEDLRYGAILHDIGKIHIEEMTLQKQGPLNHNEWVIMQQHPVIGANMVKNIPFLSPAVPAVLYHHECWDGSGYPHGLKGNEIPMMARVVAVADAFDAMTTTRSYRQAQSIELAFKELVKGEGTLFDPDVIEAFKKCWHQDKIQEIFKAWNTNNHLEQTPKQRFQ